jgi:hypothetical protein
MPTQYSAKVFDIEVALKHRLGKIAKWRHDRNHQREQQPISQTVPRRALRANEYNRKERTDSSTD